MKSLKEKIINEMQMTDKDKLIKQIIKEYPSFSPFKVIEITEKIIKEICDNCNRKDCWHKYKPYLKNNYNKIDCLN